MGCKCIADDCSKIPVYNIEGAKTALYCAAHKKDGMINIKSKRCAIIMCDTRVSNKNTKAIV